VIIMAKITVGKVADGVIPPRHTKVKPERIFVDSRAHRVRVMHRECVGVKARDRRKLGNYRYAVVEYRGATPVRVISAGDNMARLLAVAEATARVHGASVVSLIDCKPLTKKRKGVDRQALHVTDINKKRECTTCGSGNRERVCKPRKASAAEIKTAEDSLAKLMRARG
jgi:hypothetical protein